MMNHHDKNKKGLLDGLRSMRGGARANPPPADDQDNSPVPEPGGLIERSRIQIDRLPLAYVLMDTDLRIRNWNRAAEAIFGYTKEEVVGADCLELLLPNPDDAQIRGIVRRLQSGDMNAHSINENRTKDGRIIVCEWFNTPVRDASGRVLGMISLTQDVTERRRTEAALAESRRRFQAVFENARDSITLIDDAGRYVDVNPAACESLGYSREELLKLDVTVITPPEFPFPMPEVMKNFIAAGTMSGEMTILRKDGVRREIEYRSVANILPGLHVGVFRDITERKRDDERLREYYDRVQALSRRLLVVQEEERRHLARELHDEIGQILTSLKFAVESWPRERLNDIHGMIDDCIHRVRELSFNLRPAHLDHLGLVPALRWLIDRYSSSTGVKVNFGSDGLDCRFAQEVETAAYRLVQEALTNIARHAQTRDAAVRVWVDGDSLKVQVEDEGVGFDRDTILAEGRSTGLSGMMERVTLLSGKLTIDSSPGGGTHLMAELPFPPSAPLAETSTEKLTAEL